MWYRRLRTGALLLLFILFALLSNALRNTPQPVMVMNDAYFSIEALTKSIGSISTIEYKQNIKNMGLGKKQDIIEMHYYYKKTSYLRIETKNDNNISIDIYTPDGMYEYIPLSNTAYYREKWRDGKPVSFQLEDKLQDIMVRGKYESFKMDRLDNNDCEIIRSVDESHGEIYEHRIWLGMLSGLELPLKEEYLVDGEITSILEYKYISINKDLEDALFELKPSDNLKIYNIQGIAKLVKDENEAEKYVKFNVVIPKYTPKDFTVNEIYIVPPIKTPSVLISYMSDMNIINFNQKNIRKNELLSADGDRIINSGGKKFVLKKLNNESFSVKWVKNGIEYEISGSHEFKSEIVKLVQSISGVWITVD